MAITAVDIAMPIQRTTEMTRNQTGEQRPELQHQQFAERLNKETNLQEQQVRQTPQSEEASIQKDGRGNNSYHKESRRKKKDKKECQTGNGKVAKSSDSMFDVSI